MSASRCCYEGCCYRYQYRCQHGRCCYIYIYQYRFFGISVTLGSTHHRLQCPLSRQPEWDPDAAVRSILGGPQGNSGMLDGAPSPRFNLNQSLEMSLQRESVNSHNPQLAGGFWKLKPQKLTFLDSA